MVWILFQTSRLGSPQLEATFDTIIEVFFFLDKNGDGRLNKKDVVKALNEASPWEKSPSHITRTRFSMNFASLAILWLLFWFLYSLIQIKTRHNPPFPSKALCSTRFSISNQTWLRLFLLKFFIPPFNFLSYWFIY
jgi:hypothetical protein